MGASGGNSGGGPGGSGVGGGGVGGKVEEMSGGEEGRPRTNHPTRPNRTNAM
jgi:hypothetical protein